MALLLETKDCKSLEQLPPTPVRGVLDAEGLSGKKELMPSFLRIRVVFTVCGKDGEWELDQLSGTHWAGS